MFTFFSLVIIFFLSFFFALRAQKKEFSVPEEVKNLKIKKQKKKIGGVILFLRKKIIHYISSSS